ncbi:MAG: Gfo/Idh/MocA family protein [Flavobacteriaceae bacterium]
MIRAGVFGAGHLGKIHLKLLQASPHFELIGFFDPDQSHAQQLQNELGYASFSKSSDLLDAIEAAFVITPTPFHFELTKSALHKSKHVFVEKPICETIEEAQEMVRLAQKKQRVGQVGHVERFNPAFLAALPHLDQPKFIEVHRLAEFNPRGTDVSVILDLMIHDIDLVLQCSKAAIKKVDANGAAVISNSVDIATARIEFEDGCVANLTASRISLKNMRRLRCFQKDAYITIDLLEKKTELVRMKKAPSNPEPFDMILSTAEGVQKQIYFENPPVTPTNAIEEEHNNFAEAIRTNQHPRVTFKDGLKALEVAQEIIEQLEAKTL